MIFKRGSFYEIFVFKGFQGLKSVLEPRSSKIKVAVKSKLSFETICKVVPCIEKVYLTNLALDFKDWDPLCPSVI